MSMPCDDCELWKDKIKQKDAKIADLEKKLKGWEEKCEQAWKVGDDVGNLRIKNYLLENRVGELEKALKRYGVHDLPCGYNYPEETGDCHCELEKALTESKSEGR